MAMGNHVSAFQSGRFSMSNRQHAMLKTIRDAPRSTVRVAEIIGWHQTTMGGCKRRGWISETPDNHGVRLTGLGRQALNSYVTAAFYRQHESFHFASCLTLEPPAHLMAAVVRSKAEGKPTKKTSGRSVSRVAQAHAA